MNLIKTYWPFALGLLSGLYFITFMVTGSQFEYFPGDLIDARFNNYILEHGYKFFTGQVDSFWNAPFMYPEENVITYSDNLLGSAPFYALFRMIGLDRETAFQAWFVLMTVLNYACSYFLLNFLFRDNYAAAIGAFVFTFSLALQCQMGHAQTYPRFVIPLALWSTFRFLEELKAKYFFLTLLLWVYQLYCGIYLGFMLLVPLSVLMVFSLFRYWRIYREKLKNRRWLILMVLSGVVNVLLLLPLMVPYMERAKMLGFYTYDRIHPTLPTISAFFFSWNGSLCWSMFQETCLNYENFWDYEIFAGGLGTLCLLVVAIFMITRAIKKQLLPSLNVSSQQSLLFVSATATFLIFMRFGGFSFYRVFFYLPGYGSMRALQRIINIELIFYAAATAGLLKLVLKKDVLLSGLFFLMLLGLVTADNYVRDEQYVHHRLKNDSQARVAALVHKAKELPPGSILSYEPDSMDSQPMDYQLDAMLASQTLNLKTMNGYSATSPAGFGDYLVKPGEASRATWLERKQKSGAQIRVVK